MNVTEAAELLGVSSRMNVFQVPDSIESKYKGSGYALVATVNNQLVDIRYLRDIADVPETEQEIALLLDSEIIAPTVRELQAIGNVHFGMCGSWEFSEL